MSEIGCSQHTYPVSACLLKPTSCTAVLCDLDQHVVCLLAGWLAESGWLAERNSRCAMLTGVQAAWNGDELRSDQQNSQACAKADCFGPTQPCQL